MVYIIHPDGTAFGPFDWKLVRFLHGLGLIIGYYVNEVGSQLVILPSENPKMLNQPAWADRYISMPSDSGFTKSQLDIFHLAGLPPFTSLGHRYAGSKIISLIQEEATRTISPQLLWRAEKEASLGWKTEPATDAQKAVILQNGMRLKPEITKGEASCLIGTPASEAQYRRLTFYGLGHIQNITKAEASELIDDHKSRFPDSEVEYLKSKDQLIIAYNDSGNTLDNKNSQAIDVQIPVFIYKNNEQNGPFKQAEILEMIAKGDLLPNDLAWQEGFSIWLPLSNVFKLNIFSNQKLHVSVKTDEALKINTEDESQIKDLLRNIELNLQQIRTFIPNLEIPIPKRIIEIKSLSNDLRHAVESYLSFTIEELKNEIFYDMGNGREYMFFFATPPTEEQLNQFKLLMLKSYFKNGRSENFNHLALVKKAFPGVKPERIDS
jgi:hypothetical protein